MGKDKPHPQPYASKHREGNWKAAADFAPRLDELHQALDAAVCAAYGWEVEILADEEEILRRLLALKLERAGGWDNR